MVKKTKSILNTIYNWIHTNELLIVIICLVLILRIPTLFDPHWYGDEEIYLTLGLAFRKGLVFYRDIFDHKPPLIYFTAALAGSVMWFRFILAVVNAINIVYFWLLSRLTLKPKPAALATFIFAILSTIPLIEGHISNGELFMILPSTIATYLLYRSIISKIKTPPKTYLLIGFWFSIAFLYKVPIIFDFAGIALFWLFFRDPKINVIAGFKSILTKPTWLVIGGFLTPVIITIIYYATHGAFASYVQTVLLQNIGYISSWRGDSGGATESILANPLVWRLLIILIISLTLFKYKRQLSKEIIFLIIWTSFSVYGALLSNRPYPHYLLQPLVPSTLLLVYLFSHTKLKDRLAGFLCSIILIGFLIENGFWYYPTLPYYHQFLRFAFGELSLDDYQSNFPNVDRNQAIADYIKKVTSDSDRIFIWGEEPAIYAMSQRLPVGRYVVSFHIRDFPNGFEETLTALTSTPPRYIIVFPKQVPEFRQLEAFIEVKYSLVTQIEEALIYRYTPTY